MKYIMFRVTEPEVIAGQNIPFIFPNAFVHIFMALAIDTVFTLHGIKATPVSAGEVSIAGVGVTCYGRSDTLKLEANVMDARDINNFDYAQTGLTDEVLRKIKEQKP
jgi:hypothetical protein